MMFCPTWVCGIWLQRPISAPCSPLCLNAPMILYFIHVLYGLYSQSMPMPMPMPHRPRAFIIIFAFNSLMTFVSVSLAISHPAQSHICQQSLRSTRSQIYLPIYTIYRFYIYPHLVESNSPFRYIYIHAAAPCAIASEQQKTEEAQYLIVKYQQSINLRCKAKQTKPKTKRRRFNYMKSTHIQNCLPRNKNKIDKTHSIQNVYKK